MKSDAFFIDKLLYDLLVQGERKQFTTRELRDAYAEHLKGVPFSGIELRKYIYKQLSRMVHEGWVVLDVERRKRDQVYHLKPMPEHLKLRLVEKGFGARRTKLPKPAEPIIQESQEPTVVTPVDAAGRLESLLKEIRLDFLSSMGEAERYKQLIEELPHLKLQVEGEYLEARDRSSRLLGHLRAVEKTLKTLAVA